MSRYVICKWSRAPERISYDGPSWDRAEIRHLRQDVYTDKELAEAHALKLTEVNPVGFLVVSLEEQNNDQA